MVLCHWYHGAPCVAGANQLKSFFLNTENSKSKSFFLQYQIIRIIAYYCLKDWTEVRECMFQWHFSITKVCENELCRTSQQYPTTTQQACRNWKMHKTSLRASWFSGWGRGHPSQSCPQFTSVSCFFLDQVEPPKYHSVGCLQWGMGWI